MSYIICKQLLTWFILTQPSVFVNSFNKLFKKIKVNISDLLVVYYNILHDLVIFTQLNKNIGICYA